MKHTFTWNTHMKHSHNTIYTQAMHMHATHTYNIYTTLTHIQHTHAYTLESEK